ncbi:MAG: MATE family efflux transporter [Terracidiphilus sp.]|jgi:MATE family multidrug resistance protein
MVQEQAKWRPELLAMIALAVPVVLSELGWTAQGIVDTIMVGRLGPAAIGAVALGNAVYFTPTLFCFGLLLGLDTLVAQAYGRNDHDECHRWLAQGVYMACILTVPLMLLLFAASFGFGPFGITPAVAVPAASYLRILTWGTLPLVLYGGTRRYLQAVGQVKAITVTIVAGNLLNWLFNWVLIYGRLGFPALGVNGSALSTLLSRIFIALAMIGFAWRYEHQRGHPLFARWAGPSLAKLRQLARLGLPAAGQMLLEVGAWNLVTLYAGKLTPVELATHTIVFNYASLTFMVPLGVSAAAAVSVGHAVGAGDAARARRAGWLALGLGTAFMLLAAATYLAIPGPLIALYTSNPEILALGRRLLWVVAAFEVFDGAQVVSTGALRGLGETRVPMLANLAGYWALGLPLGLTLCFTLRWGIYGLWIGLSIALAVISSTLVARWRRDSARLALSA